MYNKIVCVSLSFYFKIENRKRRKGKYIRKRLPQTFVHTVHFGVYLANEMNEEKKKQENNISIVANSPPCVGIISFRAAEKNKINLLNGLTVSVLLNQQKQNNHQ